MADKIEELIKEIAVKHGIAVGRDDPIMILQTINERLILDGQTAQQQLLSHFKAELEEIAHRWSEDAKGKAERVLNASLNASKEAMANGMAEGTKRAADDLDKVAKHVAGRIEKEVAGIRKVVAVNLVAALLVMFSVVWLLVKVW
jgi:flagellar biogenesis protein FliO